jgi:5-methylcytosine-specific restriction endonuclease McrA
MTETQIFELLVKVADSYGESRVNRAIRRFKSRKQRSIQAGKKVEKRRAVPKSWTRAAFERQKGICPRCAEPLDLSEKDRRLKVTGDHHEPISTGGLHTIENIDALHSKCNSAKGNRSVYDDAKAAGQSIAERLRLCGR